jgi:enamine deaminase RidA (YjgF/YER057c/UK114 family)
MKKDVVIVKNAASLGGLNSHAIKAGNLIFVSGCTGVDPFSGMVVGKPVFE